MPDYKESILAGTKWQRCCRVVISNVYGKTPVVELVEEAALSDGTTVVASPLGRLAVPFAQSAEIPILDLVTGLPTGQMITHLEMYQHLFSLYMQQAAIRDALQPPDPGI